MPPGKPRQLGRPLACLDCESLPVRSGPLAVPSTPQRSFSTLPTWWGPLGDVRSTPVAGSGSGGQPASELAYDSHARVALTLLSLYLFLLPSCIPSSDCNTDSTMPTTQNKLTIEECESLPRGYPAGRRCPTIVGLVLGRCSLAAGCGLRAMCIVQPLSVSVPRTPHRPRSCPLAPPEDDHDPSPADPQATRSSPRRAATLRPRRS